MSSARRHPVIGQVAESGGVTTRRTEVDQGDCAASSGKVHWAGWAQHKVRLSGRNAAPTLSVLQLAHRHITQQARPAEPVEASARDAGDDPPTESATPPEPLTGNAVSSRTRGDVGNL